MGYRRNLGATRACRFHDGFIEVEGPSPRKFQTSVKINTDWQTNMYTGTLVVFLLIDSDTLYIGLRNGTINVCASDGTLLALHSWEAPTEIIKSVVGYYRDRNYTKEAVVDWDEPSLIHIRGLRRTFVLNSGLTALEGDVSPDILLSGTLAETINKGTGLSVILKGGVPLDEQESGYWRTDKDISSVPALQFGQ